jgi:hypothetical protein
MEGLNTFKVSTVAEKRPRVKRALSKPVRNIRFIGLILSVYRPKIQKTELFSSMKNAHFEYPRMIRHKGDIVVHNFSSVETFIFHD